MTLSNATVTIRSTSTTSDDGLGNTTTTTVDTVLEWALIAPRSSEERSDSRSPAVISAATLYGPFDTVLDSNDVIVVADHSPAMDGEWQVEGRPGAWSLGDWKPGLEVALKRTGAA